MLYVSHKKAVLSFKHQKLLARVGKGFFFWHIVAVYMCLVAINMAADVLRSR